MAPRGARNDIFVGNLPFGTTEDTVRAIFNEVGRVMNVRMAVNVDTGKPRGYCFVEYDDTATALSAIRNLNNRDLNGRPLRVNYSNNSNLTSEFGGDDAMMDQQQQQQQQQQPQQQQQQPQRQQQQQQQQQQRQHHQQHHQQHQQPPKQHQQMTVQQIVEGMAPRDVWEAVRDFKALVASDPKKAALTLSQNPSLTEALMHMMVHLGMVKNPPFEVSAALSSSSLPPPPQSSSAFSNRPMVRPPPQQQQQQHQQQHQQQEQPNWQQPDQRGQSPTPSRGGGPGPNELIAMALELTPHQLTQLPPDRRAKVEELRKRHAPQAPPHWQQQQQQQQQQSHNPADLL